MSKDMPQLGVDLSEEDKDRAISEGQRWVGDYLERAPFLEIYIALTEHALTQLRLALGPRYGRSAVSDVLKIILRTSGLTPGDAVTRRIEEGDLSLLSDFDLGIDWEDISAEFAHLFAYARYGYGRHFNPEKSGAEIEEILGHFRLAAADPGVRAAAGEHFEWIRDLQAAGEARWAIDHGRSVMPDDLAALAEVKPKTVANLLAARELASDPDGRIPAAEALRYLERRGNFIRSNWQYPVDESPEVPEPSALSEQVFVPVDSEGNPFLPSIARRGRNGVARYAIGAKNDPEYVEDYWEALDRLARMPTPRWRRPPFSGKGGWSLVSGQEGWRRFARADLERMVEAVRVDSQ